jgi:hypothetical protein
LLWFLHELKKCFGEDWKAGHEAVKEWGARMKRSK